ncbi:MAG: aldo/keto reductase [Granulosicoccus sp.]|nr:aldo/keto reductase [Granulosicoccus sp.]
MNYRNIASFSVYPVGLGAMNLSFGYGSVDDQTAAKVLTDALDAGINFIDTAFIYGAGHNETLIGQVLAAHRNDYVLATKCGLSPDGIDSRPVTIRQQCETSLKRLQTDVIDLYYLHRVDPTVAIEESVGALSELVKEGKVREIGLSEVCCDTLRRAQAEHPIAAVQSEYSLWSRTPEHGILELCREFGICFVPFSPLGRGFLAGSAKSVNELEENDLRATIARPRFEEEAFLQNQQVLVPFQAIAQQNQCSMAQLALAWLLARENQTMVPIPGTRSLAHMRENTEAATISLDQSTIDQLDQLINENTIIGTRYTEARMQSTDSERDIE